MYNWGQADELPLQWTGQEFNQPKRCADIEQFMPRIEGSTNLLFNQTTAIVGKELANDDPTNQSLSRLLEQHEKAVLSAYLQSGSVAFHGSNCGVTI